MKILLTGGSGLLGQELQKHLNCYAPSHQEMDITKPKTIKGTYDLIIHAAAYTDVAKAEIEKYKCLRINRDGTLNLVSKYPTTPFVYISSEYAKDPVNIYGRSKLAGEVVVTHLSERYLIIRTLFKPNPWPFEYAFTDQYTQGDYVDVIAPLIVKVIENWSRDYNHVMYVGTGRKTIFELARRTKPIIKPNSINDMKNINLPRDYI